MDYQAQPRYAGDEFVCADVYKWFPKHGHEFDVVHASPPCQRYSSLAGRTGFRYPDSVSRVRAMLAESGKPWVIENLPEAPLIDPVVLCGTQFDLCAAADKVRWIRRHRHFESTLDLVEPDEDCSCDLLPIGGVYGSGGGGQQTRGYRFNLVQGRLAMEIDWMNRKELSQAIPPAYTTFVGFQLRRLL